MNRQHHYIKILPEYYNAIDSGEKSFEVRYNDRNYQVHDILGYVIMSISRNWESE